MEAAKNTVSMPSSGRNHQGFLGLFRGFLKSLDSDSTREYVYLAWLFVLAYAPYILPPIAVSVFLALVYWVGFQNVSLLWKDEEMRLSLLVASVAILATALVLYFKLRPLPCYLVDFASFKSVDEHKLTTELNDFFTQRSQSFTKKNMLFQLKVFLKSGLGEETYGPPFLFKDGGVPCLSEGRAEMEHMMFGALDELFGKTGLNPSRVDFLVANISMFYPAPSLSSHVINRYKMREDVKSYNISGMGCAAGMIAVDLAKDILRVHKNKYVVVVGTENITLNWYFGNDRSMMVPNCLFRCGSYALLLSNVKGEKHRSKFQLLQSFRTTTGARDTSYNVIVTKEDEQGIVGTALSIKLLDVAAQALRISMMKLVPSMMPAEELLKAATSWVQKVVLKKKGKLYMPNFKKAFTHFCLHPGGKAVVDGIGKNLGLTDYDMEPARMALHRFGNTSSSGLWYAMAYLEAKERLKQGDKVWQVALGSGFKCNSVVWKVMRNVNPLEGCNPWLDCLHRYPVEIPHGILPDHPYYKVVQRGERILREEAMANKDEHNPKPTSEEVLEQKTKNSITVAQNE